MQRGWRVVSLAMILFLSLATMAHAETVYEVVLQPGDYTKSTTPIEWDHGLMEIQLQNSGEKPIYYYVIHFCAPGTDTCPVVDEGMIPPGQSVAHQKQVPDGKYLFKVDCPTGDCSATGSIR